MHFTRKYAFILIVQHLLSQIKQKDPPPEAQVEKGFKSKETGNESTPKYECRFSDSCHVK
jgi:hypothetical protein